MNELLALVGPTAAGKTAVAVDVAEAIGAEIVCVDSMTIYRGMDVGTAKPSASERARVAHHLLDVVSPAEPMTVARFQALAREAIAGVRARGRVPLIAGGSGLYFRAAVDALSFPPTDAEVRARLEQHPTDQLAAQLRAQDPAATFVDAGNRRRIVRALEVIELTGRPFSSFRDAWDRYGDVAVAGLSLDPAEHRARIEARVRAQLDRGLLDEVRALCDAGHRQDLVRIRAIPYADALARLDGVIDDEELIERAARATWRLARRQLSWFRKDPRVRWFDAGQLERTTSEVRAYYVRNLQEDRV